MTAGFEAYNDNGKLQFSTETSNYRILSAGSCTIYDWYWIEGTNSYTQDPLAPGIRYAGTNNWYEGEAPNAPAGTEILAFSCSDAYAYGYLKKGKIFFQTQPARFYNAYLTNRTGLDYHECQWVALASFRTATPTSSGVGLQIFNGDGGLGWDSNMKPVLVQDVQTYNPSSNYPSGINVDGNNYIMGHNPESTRSQAYYKLGVKGTHVAEFAFEPAQSVGNSISSQSTQIIGII